MKKGYYVIITALTFIAAFIMVVLGFQSLGVINLVDDHTIVVEVDPQIQEYDGTPLEAKFITIAEGEDTLIPGDEIKVVDYTTLKDVGKVQTETSIAVIDKDGFDVTNNYKVIVKESTCEITPRTIDFSLNPQYLTKQYDGEEFILPDDAITPSDKLLKTDHIEVNLKTKPLNIGTFKSKIDIKIIDDNNIDVTNNYKFDFNKLHTFEITRNKLDIQFLDTHKEYDGYPLTCEDYKISNDTPLLQGHRIKLGGPKKFIKNVGFIEDGENYIEIVDSFGESVSEFYDVNVIPAKLEIIKRKVNVEPINTEKIYDGKPHNLSQYRLLSGSILEGHNLIISSKVNKTEVGEFDSELKYEVFDALGHNVTENYDFTNKVCKFKINKRPIELEPRKTSKVYDGNPFIVDSVNITSGELVFGDYIKPVLADQITDVGHYDIQLNTRIYDEKNHDVTKNYTFNGMKSYRFDIEPLDILIDIKPTDIVYSSQYDQVILNDINTKIKECNIREVNFDATKLIFNIGKFKEEFKGIGYYPLDPTYLSYLGEGVNNYNILFKDTIKVDRGNAKLKYNDVIPDFKYYDGLDFKVRNNQVSLFEIDGDNLIEVNDIKVRDILAISESKITDTGVFKIVDINAFTKEGLDITSLYKIDYSECDRQIVIKKRPIGISLDSIGVRDISEVNEKVIQHAISIDTTTPLMAGDHLKSFHSTIDVDQYKVTVDNIIFENSYGEDVTDCYEFDSILYGEIFEII